MSLNSTNATSNASQRCAPFKLQRCDSFKAENANCYVQIWQKALDNSDLAYLTPQDKKYQNATNSVKIWKDASDNKNLGRLEFYKKVGSLGLGEPIFEGGSFLANIIALLVRPLPSIHDSSPIKFRAYRLGLDLCSIGVSLIRLAMRVMAIALGLFKPHKAAYLMKKTAQLNQFLAKGYVLAAEASIPLSVAKS